MKMAVVNPKLINSLKSAEFKAKLAVVLKKHKHFNNLAELQKAFRHELNINK